MHINSLKARELKQDVFVSDTEGMAISNVTVECEGVFPFPPSPPPPQAFLSVNASAVGISNVAQVSVLISSPSAAISGIQFELVGLGCVKDVMLISVEPFPGGQGKARVHLVHIFGC